MSKNGVNVLDDSREQSAERFTTRNGCIGCIGVTIVIQRPLNATLLHKCARSVICTTEYPARLSLWRWNVKQRALKSESWAEKVYLILIMLILILQHLFHLKCGSFCAVFLSLPVSLPLSQPEHSTGDKTFEKYRAIIGDCKTLFKTL